MSEQTFIEHNPGSKDGFLPLRAALMAPFINAGTVVRYQRLHKVLADGNFVLTACEGYLYGIHTSFYDLYRLEDGKIVEHWDTSEPIPPRSEWKNENGKF